MYQFVYFVFVLFYLFRMFLCFFVFWIPLSLFLRLICRAMPLLTRAMPLFETLAMPLQPSRPL